jgi:hypothetical protein
MTVVLEKLTKKITLMRDWGGDLRVMTVRLEELAGKGATNRQNLPTRTRTRHNQKTFAKTWP